MDGVQSTLSALLKTRIDMEAFNHAEELQRVLEGRKPEDESAG